MSDQQWVAIIDDDESIRTSLSRVLHLAGVQARGFGSAEEFLSRTSGPEPACLVLDIHLGAGLNGIELQDRLESDGSTIPVIFMTGHADLLLARRHPDGVPDFLKKPFETDELLARVRRHVGGKRGSTPSTSRTGEGP